MSCSHREVAETQFQSGSEKGSKPWAGTCQKFSSLSCNLESMTTMTITAESTPLQRSESMATLTITAECTPLQRSASKEDLLSACDA